MQRSCEYLGLQKYGVYLVASEHKNGVDLAVSVKVSSIIHYYMTLEVVDR